MAETEQEQQQGTLCPLAQESCANSGHQYQKVDFKLPFSDGLISFFGCIKTPKEIADAVKNGTG